MEPDRSGRGLEQAGGRVVAEQWVEEVVREWDRVVIVFAPVVDNERLTRPVLPVPR